MKKLLSIIVLGLLLGGNSAFAEILESSDKHIWVSLPKGTSKTEAFSSKRIEYAKGYCSKLKKNTYSFRYKNFYDYNRIGWGKHRFRFICAKNKYEAVENLNFILQQPYPRGAVYSEKVDIPKLEHIDLSHIGFPDPDAEKNYEAKIKKEKEKKERAEAIASGDISFTIKDKKEQCTAIGFEPATEKFADCVLRLVELDVKTQQTNQIALAQNQGNQQIADQLKKQSNDQSSQYFLDLGQKLLNPQSTVSAPSTSTCTISGGVYKNISCW